MYLESIFLDSEVPWLRVFVSWWCLGVVFREPALPGHQHAASGTSQAVLGSMEGQHGSTRHVTHRDVEICSLSQ